MASQEEQVAKAFTEFYYSAFDRNRSELLPLYRPFSMLTFEGQRYSGDQKIVEKLVGLPFQKVQHQVVTVDAQPSNPQPGPILVTVTGRLLVDEESNPQQFSQTFQLIPEEVVKKTVRVISLYQTQNIDQLIVEALVADRYSLLNVICNSVVAGDAAAIVSKGILKILNRQPLGSTEDFLKYIVKNRIIEYKKKSRDLSDVTRDNSLVTMLLVAYARYEGSAYLSLTLSKPLNTVYNLLSNCEIDPQKINSEDVQKTMGENRKNLEEACKILFSHIFDNRKRMPTTILDMCAFLSQTVEELMEKSNPSIALLPPSVERKLSKVAKKKPEISESPSGMNFLGDHTPYGSIKAKDSPLPASPGNPFPISGLASSPSHHSKLSTNSAKNLAITTPEPSTFTEKITPAVRRGLILCGKMLTSLCNDTEFGHKEQSLMDCNEFLIPYRQNMKEFLYKCCNSGNLVLSPLRQSLQPDGKAYSNPNLLDHSRDYSHKRNCSQPQLVNTNETQRPISHARKLQSLSAENLRLDYRSLTNPPPPDADIVALFQSLSKNIDKLEKDIIEKKKTMDAADGEKLVVQFHDLKMLLDSGSYGSGIDVDLSKTKHEIEIAHVDNLKQAVAIDFQSQDTIPSSSIVDINDETTSFYGDLSNFKKILKSEASSQDTITALDKTEEQFDRQSGFSFGDSVAFNTATAVSSDTASQPKKELWYRGKYMWAAIICFAAITGLLCKLH
ncbi:Nuclear transport factor 2 [Boothiomyces sp. JEL0866]|nr:Nuclear transport factor 2 [Boothiomyces sp. JEL0866]KAJ3325237.1 Nuclear transport factor 2 [Boothiomyces sp. JEL0866]